MFLDKKKINSLTIYYYNLHVQVLFFKEIQNKNHTTLRVKRWLHARQVQLQITSEIFDTYPPSHNQRTTLLAQYTILSLLSYEHELSRFFNTKFPQHLSPFENILASSSHSPPSNIFFTYKQYFHNNLSWFLPNSSLSGQVFVVDILKQPKSII